MKKILFLIISLNLSILYAQVTRISDQLITPSGPANPIIFSLLPLPDTIPASSGLRPLGQEKGFCRNSIYLELLGPGLFYSINYDYRITSHLSLRAGFSTWYIKTLDFIFFQINDIRWTSFPVMLNYLIGKKSSHLEIGAGLMPAFLSTSGASIFWETTGGVKGTALIGIANLGYRYQRDDGGFIFRIGITPMYNSSKVYFGTGISLGYGF